MKRKIANLCVLAFLLGFFQAQAQEFNPEKLDKYLEQLDIHNKAMCSVAIARAGSIVYQNQIGFASVQENKKTDGETIFRIGSISKTFTSVIVLQLIEEGRLSQDTPLSVFYPGIRNAAVITVSHLLRHRSGIHNFTADESYLTMMTSFQTKEDMLSMMASLPSDFTPGAKMSYSNTNYVLLGYIIEEITSSTLGEQLRKRITGPLGLKHTSYGGEINTDENQAASYRFENGSWVLQPETDMSIPHGAGALVSTPEDLVLFIQGLFSGKLVSETSLTSMKTMQDGYGMGMFRMPFYDRYGFGHNGGIDGFVSTVVYFPEDTVAFAAVSNGVNCLFNTMSIGILSIYFNKPFDLPDFSEKPVTISMKDLKEYAGYFTSEEVPLDIELTVKKNSLFGRAAGQEEFPLTPYSTTEFRFEQAGIVVKFSPGSTGSVDYDSFVMIQGGRKVIYSRKDK